MQNFFPRVIFGKFSDINIHIETLVAHFFFEHEIVANNGKQETR